MSRSGWRGQGSWRPSDRAGNESGRQPLERGGYGQAGDTQGRGAPRGRHAHHGLLRHQQQARPDHHARDAQPRARGRGRAPLRAQRPRTDAAQPDEPLRGRGHPQEPRGPQVLAGGLRHPAPPGRERLQHPSARRHDQPVQRAQRLHRRLSCPARGGHRLHRRGERGPGSREPLGHRVGEHPLRGLRLPDPLQRLQHHRPRLRGRRSPARGARARARARPAALRAPRHRHAPGAPARAGRARGRGGRRRRRAARPQAARHAREPRHLGRPLLGG